MSIPKIIHYCWFGGNTLPSLSRECIQSWRTMCPEYKLCVWNENNFDLSQCPQYVQQAYAMKKWAFVSDYVRLKVIHDYGGIYLDTDVELIASLDCLLENSAFFGVQCDCLIDTGLGFGAEKGTPILAELMSSYETDQFIEDNGKLNLTPCPERETQVMLMHGYTMEDKRQFLSGNMLVLPSEILCPMDYRSGKTHITKQTISIHHYAASWYDDEDRRRNKKIVNHNRRMIFLKKILRVFGLEQWVKKVYHIIADQKQP